MITSLFSNISSRIKIIIINQLSVLISLPYIANSLGLENFGLLSISLIIIQLCFTVTEWGFGFYSIEKIKELKNDNYHGINTLLSSIYFAKIIFITIIFPVIIILYLTNLLPTFSFNILLLTMLGIFFASLNPLWFYQAINKTEQLVLPTIISRMIYLIIIFTLVNYENDYLIAIFAQVIYLGIASIFPIFQIYKLGYNFIKFDYSSSKKLLLETKNYFIASVIQNQTHLILGFLLTFFSNPIQIGLFNIADQLLRAGNAFINIIPESILTFSRNNISNRFIKNG